MRINSTWVSFGTVAAYSSANLTVDLSVFDYKQGREPQVWFQGYGGPSVTTVTAIDYKSCSLRCFNPTSVAASLAGWLKSCESWQ